MTHDHDVSTALRQVDLNLLVALDVLFDTQNVTRSAERLGVTQSAMSHSLRRLRDVFEDPLLVRSGAGMALTPRAEALVVPLRAALVALGRALAAPAGFDPATAARRFRIATPDLFDALLLPRLLDRVRTRAPGVDLVVVPLDPARQSDALHTGDLDLAIVPVLDGQTTPGSVELVQRSLFRDRYLCFVREGHAAVREGGLDLQSFAVAGHAMVSPTGSGPGIVDPALQAVGLTRRVVLRLPTFAAAPRIVANSDLILTAPASMVGLLDGLAVLALEPPLPLPGHGIAMVWHRRFTADPGHEWLRGLLTEVGATAEAR